MLFKVSARVAMAAFNTLPKEDREQISAQLSAVNAPRIAAHENTAFTALQINVAAADQLSSADDIPVPAVVSRTRHSKSATVLSQSAVSSLKAQLESSVAFMSITRTLLACSLSWCDALTFLKSTMRARFECANNFVNCFHNTCCS